MTEFQLQTVTEPAKITALLRSAAFLGATLECQISAEAVPIKCTILKLTENGVSRSLNVSALYIQASDINEAKHFFASTRESGTITVSFIAGDIRVDFTAAVMSVSRMTACIEAPSEMRLSQPRNVPRRVLQVSAQGWGCIEIEKAIITTRITLVDYSSTGLGLELSTQQPISETGKGFVSGVLTSNALSVRIERAEIINLVRQPAKEDDDWSVYRAGCQISNRDTKSNTPSDLAPELRRSRRFTQGDYVRLESSLNPGRHYKAQVKDISVKGLSCSFPFPNEATAFPRGAPVKLSDLGLSGRVIECMDTTVRIALDIRDSKGFKSWFLRFTEAFHPTMDTWIDFFDHAAMSFASSGGTSESFLRDSSKIHRFAKHATTHLDRNPHWIQAWVEKANSGEVIGHISCVRYGDNFWYAGDLWGSQLNAIHKQFAKRFLESFVTYALACSPYPKSLGIWKPDHPYWRKMNEALAGEYASYIYEEALCYKVSLLDRPNFSSRENASVEVFEPVETPKINRILQNLEPNGTKYFAELMGFHADAFGSPQLSALIHSSGYSFERLYARLTASGSSFLAIYSRYPAGTSIQHHQETIWLLPLGEHPPDQNSVESATDAAASLALKLGILPVYVKIATKHLIPFLPKPMRLVVSDPRIWCLA